MPTRLGIGFGDFVLAEQTGMGPFWPPRGLRLRRLRGPALAWAAFGFHTRGADPL